MYSRSCHAIRIYWSKYSVVFQTIQFLSLVKNLSFILFLLSYDFVISGFLYSSIFDILNNFYLILKFNNHIKLRPFLIKTIFNYAYSLNKIIHLIYYFTTTIRKIIKNLYTISILQFKYLNNNSKIL